MLPLPPLLLAAAAAGTKEFSTLQVTTSAPWASDVSLEAAALIHTLHGEVLPFWQSWAEAKAKGCGNKVLPCVLEAIVLVPSLAPIERATLRMALAARLEAPKVSAWAQLSAVAAVKAGSADGPLWATACGVVHPNVDVALASDCGSAMQRDSSPSDPPVPLDLDHHLLATSSLGLPGSPEAGDQVAVVVYVDPHHALFAAALAALAALPPASQARLRLRYLPIGSGRASSSSSSSSSSAAVAASAVPLSGFGASLRVKSSEYKVVDDAKAAAAESAVEDAEAEDGSWGGGVEGSGTGGDALARGCCELGVRTRSPVARPLPASTRPSSACRLPLPSFAPAGRWRHCATSAARYRPSPAPSPV
jgi:hypothetical protein